MSQVPAVGIVQPTVQDPDKKTHNFKLPWKRNKHKGEPDAEPTGGQEQHPPSTVDPNRSSNTLTRRPVPVRTGSDNEPGLEALRQKGRDIEEEMRRGQPRPPHSIESSIDPQIHATPVMSSGAPRDGAAYRPSPNGGIEIPVTQSVVEVPSPNPMPFPPGQYSISTVTTATSQYTTEPVGLENTYMPGGFPVEEFSVQPTSNLRAATLPQCEHSPDMCDYYKRETKVLEAQKEELKRRLNMAEYDLSRKTKLIESMQSLNDTHERVLSEKDALISSYEKSMKNLQAKHDAASSQVAKLNEDNSALQGQLDMANKEALQIRSELRRPIEEKWFKVRWQDLRDKVELLANQYFTGRLRQHSSMLTRGRGLPISKPDNPLSKKLTRLTHSPGQYLGSDNERPLLIQAFIWWVLTNKIFDHMDDWGEGLYWTGQAREHFLELKREMRPKCRKDFPRTDPTEVNRLEAENRKYHQWRETTSIMLVANEPMNRRTNANGYLITDIVTWTTDSISPYIVRNKDSPRPMAEPDIRKQLQAIVTDAIELDAFMYQQRAWIFCEQWDSTLEGNPEWGFKFSPDDMDMVPGPDQTRGGRKRFLDPQVELIVQPALFRRGTYEGIGYGDRVVLCPAKVVVGEDPTRPAAQKY